MTGSEQKEGAEGLSHYEKSLGGGGAVESDVSRCRLD